jgi:hypothetical protein
MERPEPTVYTVGLLLVVYLLWNTGLVSDDFVDLVRFQTRHFPGLMIPTGNFINVPVGHLTHHIWFRFFAIDSLTVDFFKIGFTIVSLYLIEKFFRLYLSSPNSFLVALVFVFFPSHDAIPFWYAPSGHLLAIAVYFYAYYLAHLNKLVGAFIAALVASFMVYGSTPVAVALFTLFLLNKQPKKGMVILVPNIIYAAYFLYMSVYINAAPSRILEPVTSLGLLKQFALQVGTFIDATLGPSMWLKLYYSLFELSALSMMVGLLVVLSMFRGFEPATEHYNPKLLASLLVMAWCSFVMFAVTGRYPQLAFNLGNRATFWGSLLLAYVLVLLPFRRLFKIGLYSGFLFAALGISDHWKAWNAHQQVVVAQIRENSEIRSLSAGTQVFVSGNQYSRFGPMSHIEFFSENWGPQAVFNLSLSKWLRVASLNRHLHYQNGYIQNKKDRRRIKVDGPYVNVYDSANDELVRVQVGGINDVINSLPEERRHWIQGEDGGFSGLLRQAAKFLMPRLGGIL